MKIKTTDRVMISHNQKLTQQPDVATTTSISYAQQRIVNTNRKIRPVLNTLNTYVV